MKLTPIKDQTDYRDQIQKPCKGLLIVVTNKADGTPANITDEEIKIELHNQSTNSVQEITPFISLAIQAEKGAQAEGYFSTDKPFYAFANDALDLDNCKFLEIELRKLSADKIYSIELYEDGQITKTFERTFNHYILAGQKETRSQVGQSEILILPNSDKIVEVSLTSRDGKREVHSLAMLQHINRLKNDLVKVDKDGTPTYGYDKILTISMSDIREFEIETDGSALDYWTQSSEQSK